MLLVYVYCTYPYVVLIRVACSLYFLSEIIIHWCARMFGHMTTYGTRRRKLRVICYRARHGLSNDAKVAMVSTAGRCREGLRAAHNVCALRFHGEGNHVLGVGVSSCFRILWVKLTFETGFGKPLTRTFHRDAERFGRRTKINGRIALRVVDT